MIVRNIATQHAINWFTISQAEILPDLVSEARALALKDYERDQAEEQHEYEEYPSLEDYTLEHLVEGLGTFFEEGFWEIRECNPLYETDVFGLRESDYLDGDFPLYSFRCFALPLIGHMCDQINLWDVAYEIMKYCENTSELSKSDGQSSACPPSVLEPGHEPVTNLPESIDIVPLT